MNKIQNKKIPDGYKITEIGVIPSDWNIEFLSTISNFKNGSAHENNIVEYGNYVVVNSKFVSSDGYVKKYSNKQFTPLFKDEIVIVMSDIPNGKALAKTFYIDKDNFYTLNQRIGSIKSTKVLPKYLNLQLNRNKYFLAFNDGVNQTNLKRDEILKCLIPVPDNPKEQELIVKVLSDMDDLIEKLDRLIEKKKLIKQGAMQELLTGKKRLPGFSNKCDEYKMEELFDFMKGSGLSKQDMHNNGKNKCLLYGELFTTYNEVIKKIKNSTNAFDGTLSKKGDILMPGSTTTTGVDLAIASALLEDNILIGGDVNILRPKKEDKIYPEFISRYLTHTKKKEISDKTQGSTIVHLYGNSLMDISIKLPTMEEQKAISEILSSMDDEIEVLENKRDKYQRIKDGAMQNLLTGKIRLV